MLGNRHKTDQANACKSKNVWARRGLQSAVSTMEQGNVTPGLMTAKQQKHPVKHPEKSTFFDSAVYEEQLMVQLTGPGQGEQVATEA